MTITRNRKIKELRAQGLTLEQIGQKHGISNERVRQIVKGKQSLYCKKHKNHYLSVCEFCQHQKNYLNLLESGFLFDELKRLSKQGRQKTKVLEQSWLIGFLRKKFKMSYLQIAKLLKRDHAAIINLHKKYE